MIRRVVWSFWSAPHRAHRDLEWFSPKHHFLSWILSVETARRHYPETALYTDDEGAELLIEGLGLPFQHVSMELNALRDQDTDWWMLGKLQTYSVQSAPFVHVDSDVYLWKPLPAELASARVFGQNPEDAAPGVPWYDAEACEYAIRTFGDGKVPVEWSCYRTSGLPQEAACCGILGGTDVDFIREYASIAIGVLTNPRNRAAFATLPDKKLYNPLFEQYLLCASARYRQVPVAYLFQSATHASETAGSAGFTHLISGTKSDSIVAKRLEQRVARDYPESYHRCLRLLSSRGLTFRYRMRKFAR